MIVDTSALVALLGDETDADGFARALAAWPASYLSAVDYVEAAVVIDGSRDPVASRRFDQLLEVARIAVLPVTPEQARTAREAYRDFGKSSGHRARLDFGDCFAYALAKERGMPLLFKGDDFTHTDVEQVVGPLDEGSRPE